MAQHLRSEPETLRDYAGLIAGMLAMWWRQRRGTTARRTPAIDTNQGES